MKVYQRLLNILAESIFPEYWSRDELVHYLKLAQTEFVKDTKILVKSSLLKPKLISRMTQAFQIGIPPVTIENGCYEIPSDCIDILSVYWNGEALGQKDVNYLNTYSGGYSSETKGIGRNFGDFWKNQKGTPKHWILFEGGIRYFPYMEEAFTQVVNTLHNSDIEDLANFRIILPEEITANSGFYMSSYGTGIWEELTLGKDYEVNDVSFSQFSFRAFILKKELASRISMFKTHYDYNVSILYVQESKCASVDYVRTPSFVDLKPLTGWDEILLEIPEIYHEAVADYAAYLALSKEGDKQQDMEKAAVYLQRYQKKVGDCTIGKAEIDIDPMNNIPFIL